MSSHPPTSAGTGRADMVSLIGYRGTGKSTAARLVAARLGWTSVDADEEIERSAGKSIQEVFASEGENAFRDWETAVVLEQSRRERAVIAWGGGVVLREQNRQAIRRGWVVWLTAHPAAILTRVAADPTTSQRRPNLTTAGGLTEIQQLLAQREPLYRECADFVVSTVDKTPEQVADEIVCFLRTRWKTSCSDIGP